MEVSPLITYQFTNPQNHTDNKWSCTSPSVFTTLYAVMNTIFALFSILGNVLILTVIKKYPIVRGPNNKYLMSVHLSVIHLIMGVILLTYPFEHIAFNNTFSAVREALVITLFTSNGGSLFTSACKRIFVTLFPFVYYARKEHENKILSVFLGIVWILALFTGFISLLSPNRHQNNTDLDRITNWSALSLSTTSRTAALILFFTFTLISILFYIIIYFHFRIRHRNLNTSVNRIPRPTIVSMCTLTMYTLCWVPYVCVLLMLGSKNMPSCACHFLLLIGFLDMACSWILNPIIDQKYRKAVLNLLCKVSMEN